MAEGVFFDLWNTLMYCPTKGMVDEIVRLLGLKGKLDYLELMDEMEETLFVDSGYELEELFRRLCDEKRVGYSPDIIAEAMGVWESRLKEAEYFPEAEAVLEDLRHDFKLGLISNTDKGGAEYARGKVSGHFDSIIMSCEAGVAKPDPLIYEMALESLDLDCRDCWMVGDNVRMDVEGALNAGMNAVLIDRERIHTKGGYSVIEDLTELRGVIR
ncbi:MAG: HAD family hydrolase [Candidatus Altiarchaeota archaeon]